jgi:hypothetical protein
MAKPNEESGAEQQHDDREQMVSKPREVDDRNLPSPSSNPVVPAILAGS